MVKVAIARGGSWYVDPARGDDSLSGSSPAQSWRTFKPAEQLRFGPGDRLLIRCGCRVGGTLHLHGSGSADAPATLAAFGEGPAPIIDGMGSPDAVTIDNGSHWVIEDLDITNQLPDRKSRNGIFVRSSEGQVVSDITLRHLHVHDVAGNDERGGGCGILVQAQNTPDDRPSRFDRVLIENCLLNDVPFNGIFVRNWDCRHRDARGRLIAPITHLTIRNNLLYNVAGDAICILTTENALIEHNEVHRSSFGQTRGAKTPSAGIWPHTSDGTIMRWNRVEGLRGMLDGLAFDVDIDCHNTLVENNLSRNNGNGFLLICGNDADKTADLTRTSHTLVRNNMSLNDAVDPRGSMTEIVSYVSDVTFDNNLFLRTLPGKRNLLLCGGWLHGTWPEQIRFTHNLICSAGDLHVVIGKTSGLTFLSNFWSGKPSPEIDDPSARNGQPSFMDAPVYSSWDCSLSPASPALAAGFVPFKLNEAGLTRDSSWLAIRDQTAARDPAPN